MSIIKFDDFYFVYLGNDEVWVVYYVEIWSCYYVVSLLFEFSFCDILEMKLLCDRFFV